MSRTTESLDPKVGEYLRGLALIGESDLHARLREETSHLEMARMQIAPEQGRLMGVLARMVGARRAIEVGVFTGYSALCVAENLPADGKLVACDVSEEWTSIGRRYWEEAGVADRIDLRIAPAAETLAAMIDEGEAGTYDFAFIDADKVAYDGYYEQCLTLLRPGGVVTLDNIFMHGGAIDPGPDDPGPIAVHALTRKIHEDDRVHAALIPIGDGLQVAFKR